MEETTNLPQQILQTSQGTLGRLQALKLFNVTHADTQVFSQIFPTELKKQTISALVPILDDVHNCQKEELIETLCTFRLLCREDGGSDDLLTEKYLNIVYKLGLSTDTELNLKIEASKCLVNMIFKSSPMLILMEEKKAHFEILELLSKDLPHPYMFAHLRILFLLSRPIGTSNIYRELADNGAISKLYGILRSLVDEDESFPNPSKYYIMREILQILFNLTIGMGSLNSKTEELMDYQTFVPNYEEVVTTLLKIFGLPLSSPTSNPALFDLKNCVINCFVNVPMKYFSILVILGDKDLTLKALFDLLEWEVRADGGQEKKGLVTIFMVVQSLLGRTPDARPYAFQRLFPGRNLDGERQIAEEKGEAVNMDAYDKDADTVGNKIIKYMTSLNMAIKYVSNELLYSLVGENADDLVRLTGFGNAAGLLAMHNLFGMGKHLERDSVASIPKTMPDLQPPKESETEEEKEVRTRENLEKMIDSGLIQVVKKE